MVSSSKDRKLKEIILRKWIVNKSFMSQKEFEKFIDLKVRQEEYQEKLISRINLYEDIYDKSALDIGSGEGGLVVALNLMGCDAQGVDIKDDNIEISKLRAKTYGLSENIFVKADAANLPFEDSSFDIIIMNQVLEHVPDIDATLKEASKLLRVGGLFFASVPNATWPYEGHVNLWFPHWLPRRLRRFYLRTMRKEKCLESNYLDDIRYLSYRGWKKSILPYFSHCLGTDLIYRKLFSEKKGFFWKVADKLSTKGPQFKFLEFFSPTTYLIARK